jgi:hypothetical protein
VASARERGDDELGVERRGQRPADHAARRQVEHDGQVPPARLERQRRDIRRPHPIQVGDGESTRQVIPHDGQVVRGVCRHADTPTAARDQAGAAHQPPEAFVPDTHATGAQRVLESQPPIGCARLSACTARSCTARRASAVTRATGGRRCHA